LILTDTGFWLALANRADRHHGVAVTALAGVREPLVTTWPVVTETCHLLARRLGARAGVTFLENAARGAFQVFALDASHLPRLATLLEQYRDLPMDLADASLVVLAESLGTGRILSTDRRDFRSYRWKRTKPFENLLPEV
jgi:predicted nucleic acid-binding protein